MLLLSQEWWLMIFMLMLHLFCSSCSSVQVDLSKVEKFKFDLNDIPKSLRNDSKHVQGDQGLLSKIGSSWRSESVIRDSSTSTSIFVRSNSSHHACDSTFLSLGIDSGSVRRKFKGFDFGSKQLKALAQGLSPCYLRLGGTSADFLTFDPNDDTTHNEESRDDHVSSMDDFYMFDQINDSTLGKSISNFTMSGKLWKNMTHFFQEVGWDLMFDFNLFKWRNGYWDPSNAQLLLNYSDAMGYNISAFQLGNEPNSFHHNFNFSIEPPVLVKDFGILKNLISQYPRYRKSPLFGPDVTDLGRHSSSRNYLIGFLEAGGSDVVAEISLHQYYLNGRTAVVNDFMDPDVLDQLLREIEIALSISQSQPHPLPIRFTETSSCYGGGAPGLSDAYVAGFLWLDKLGLSAKYGVSKVFRQTFFGGNYGLLSRDAKPNPDYFLSLLYKRLILGPVFNVTVQPENKDLRIYAHCTRTDFYSYPKGSLTLAYLNIGEVDHVISFSQFHGQSLYLFSLTPGDDNGLKSRLVKLNGRVLKMNGATLPPLIAELHSGEITIPAQTFGFIVVPTADISLCKQYPTNV